MKDLRLVNPGTVPRTQLKNSYDEQYYGPINQAPGPYKNIFNNQVIPYERPEACKSWHGP